MAARGLFSGSTAGFGDTFIVADAGLDCKVSQAKFTFL